MQYDEGTVAVTNGSADIVGTDTEWLINVPIGSLFSTLGSGVPYFVANVVDDTHITLASLYGGDTDAAAAYSITTSFTPFRQLPYPEFGDIDTPTIIKRAMAIMDAAVWEQFKGADIASAATVNLDNATGEYVNITGTTAITAITLASGRERTVRFAGSLLLTHGASLELPDKGSIQTAAGDFAVFRGDTGGVVRCTQYQRLNRKGADIASAATVNLDNATGEYVNITGTTAITAITLAEGRPCTVRFTGVLTLTHGASLVLPTNASIVTEVGDIAMFRGDAGGVVRCVNYMRASGKALAIEKEYENALIGANFSTNPWQRGTSFAAVANNSYTADRWSYIKVGTMVHTVSKAADAPTVGQAGVFTQHCLMADCTTADVSIDAGDFCCMQQKIEGYNFTTLAQRDMVMPFWHKHTKTGTYCVSFTNSGADRSYVVEYTQAVADTWEYKEILIPASPSAGTWNYTNGIGLVVRFALAGGTTFQTTPNAWNTGNFVCTANQVNACDNVANNFRIAIPYLHAGSKAFPFPYEDATIIRERCARYYQKSFDEAVVPAQATGNSNGAATYVTQVAGATDGGVNVRFPAPMRTPPSLTFYNIASANNDWRNLSGGADSGGSAASQTGESGFFVRNAGSGGDVAQDRLGINWSADAEL